MAPLTRTEPTRTFRPVPVLTATRVSRCVRERLDAGGRAVVLGVQRRACHLTLDAGPLVILSMPDVPLAPNAFAVDLGAHPTPAAAGFRAGQSVSLSLGSDFAFRTVADRQHAGIVRKAKSDPVVDWWVALGAGEPWEPRPRVPRPAPPDLAARLRAVRVTVVAEGARESLLPLLWMAESDRGGSPAGILRAAAPAARMLVAAAIRRDATSVGRAAGSLAGLGSGLTPSGDDVLAGFAAAWALIGASLALDFRARRLVTGAILSGAGAGASPIGRAWLDHACRGELLEPMTRFVALLLAEASLDLTPAVRGALAVGSSSGADWMVGFLLGASAVLGTTTGSRRW
jgi:hypothetical protein